ncbi:MAG: hypothetical protein ACSHX8_02605 [Opitutaceae bacterium]
MENLLEVIVPLVFAAIYFFGNMLSKKEEDGAQPPQRPANTQDSEAIERQRRIQEEIRRKIQERRQATEGGQPTTPPAVPASSERLRPHHEAVEARRKEVETRRAQREHVKGTRETVHGKQAPPRLTPAHTAGGYESQMEAQLQRIEETKRRAEALKREAATSAPTASSERKRKRSSHTFSGPVRNQLKDPAAVRAAFIYGEVLGQPASLRQQSSVPGLSE